MFVQLIQLYVEAPTREELLFKQMEVNRKSGMTFKFSHMIWDEKKQVWFQNYVADGSFLVKEMQRLAIEKEADDGRRLIVPNKKNNRGS